MIIHKKNIFTYLHPMPEARQLPLYTLALATACLFPPSMLSPPSSLFLPCIVLCLHLPHSPSSRDQVSWRQNLLLSYFHLLGFFKDLHLPPCLVSNFLACWRDFTSFTLGSSTEASVWPSADTQHMLIWKKWLQKAGGAANRASFLCGRLKNM